MTHRRLADEEIRSQFFVVPLRLVRLLVSTELAEYVAVHDEISRRTGGTTVVVGWPDGTTVVLTHANSTEPIDVEILAALYKEAHAISEYRASDGWRRAH